MIFQHTIGLVLSGKKTATTRIWQDHYRFCFDEMHQVHSGDAYHPQNAVVKSTKTGRKLYYVGQQHSVQPGRGKKGIATIEITRICKVMIHNVIDDPDFIRREGFNNKAEFLKVWRAMHGTKQIGLHIHFKCLEIN